MMKRKPYVILLIATIVMSILGGIAYCIVSGTIERWVYNQGLALLSSRFGTVVTLDDINVNLSKRTVSLYGFAMEDRQHRDMIKVDTINVKVALMPLLRHKLVIDRAEMNGVDMRLYKERRDTAANFQFALDAFKKKPASTDIAKDGKRHSKWDFALNTFTLNRTAATWDVLSEARKEPGHIDANHMTLENIQIVQGSVSKTKDSLDVMLKTIRGKERNSGMALRVASFDYKKWRKDSVTLLISYAGVDYQDMRLGGKYVCIRQQRGSLSTKFPMSLRADSLTFTRNNGKPHKRTGKPHRGYFDTGHIDAVMNVDAILRQATRDSIVTDIKGLSAYDRKSGLDIRSLKAIFSMRKDTLALYDMAMRLQHSVISSRKICGVLQRNAQGKAHDVRLTPFDVTSKIVLRDIAKPFAPVLSDFSTPLLLNVTAGGTLSRFDFKDIRVTTRDQRLLLTAQGKMLDVTKRYDLRLNFKDINLTANNGIKEAIVKHFAKKVRMKMLQQMQRLGNIRYKGTLTVAFKREDITGTLFTKYGNADFAFTIDGRSKTMTGIMSSDAFQIGEVMKVNGLGTMKARAAYSFNVASKSHRTNITKGRLPIGWMRATVDSTRFKKIPFKNVSAMIHSDGTTAMGEIAMPKKLFDVSIQFWYTQTDSIQELRFKPKLTRHKKKSSPFAGIKKWKDYMKEAREKAGIKIKGGSKN